MAPWLWEIILAASLALRGGRLLERLFTKFAPRPWRERVLPPSVSASSFHIWSEFFFYAVLVAIGAGVVAGVIGTEAAWRRLVAVFLPIIGIVWGIHSLASFKFWWVLEQGCPPRAELDALSQRSGIPLKRVRLRDSNKLRPRVFLDGSVELPTEFFDLPTEESAFALAAMLHQKQKQAPWRKLRACFVWGTWIVALSWALSLIEPFRNVSFFVFAMPLFTYAAYFLNSAPGYSQATLRFALENTGDFEAAKRAVLRLDSQDADARLKELHTRWKAQPVASSAAVAISTNSTSPAQQLTQERKW